MISSTPLLQALNKHIANRPKRVKQQHKTYRELLGLDRPRKKIYVESDNQNDDFLQKLLRQQEMKKKRKKNTHQSEKKDRKSNKQRKTLQKRTEDKFDKKQTAENLKQAAIDKKQIAADSLSQGNKKGVDEHKKNSNPVLNSKPFEIEDDGEMGVLKVWKRIQSARKQSPAASKPVSAHRKEAPNAGIMIDDSDTTPFIVTQALHHQAHSQTRSGQAYKYLRQAVTQKKQIKPKMSPVLDPESHRIIHQIQQNEAPCFLAKTLSVFELMSLSDVNRVKKPEKRITKKQKLFKNDFQQELMLKNIVGSKKSRISLPNLGSLN